jgi:hypothetical protein
MADRTAKRGKRTSGPAGEDPGTRRGAAGGRPPAGEREGRGDGVAPAPRPTRPRMWPADRPWAGEGARLVQADLAGTALFTLVAAGAVLSESLRGIATVVSVALFAVGTVAFLFAYAKAIGRSRTHVLGVGGIYFLSGCAPRAVQLRLLGALAAQTVVAVAAASARPFTSLAFGMLVPMFGLGLAGVWGAFHGAYPERRESSASLPADE